MEANLVTCLVQIGIRTGNHHQRLQAERFGVEMIEIKDWRSESSLFCDGPAYLSLDLDVIDPGGAPGGSPLEPEGLTTRGVI